MKKIWLCLILVFFAVSQVSAKEPPIIRQNKIRQQQILNYVTHVPLPAVKNARSLAVYLTKPFNNKIEKMQAIAYWIATHIAYDSYKFNGVPNLRNMKYHYDVFKARTGICIDFAKLFQEMSLYAGIRGVNIVSGFVVDTKYFKDKYNPKQFENAHAWNAVNINGYTYYIDTTFMATQTIAVKNQSGFNQWSHKQEIIKRSRTNSIVKSTSDIRYYYFLFTPQDEVRKLRTHHFVVNAD